MHRMSETRFKVLKQKSACIIQCLLLMRAYTYTYICTYLYARACVCVCTQRLVFSWQKCRFVYAEPGQQPLCVFLCMLSWLNSCSTETNYNEARLVGRGECNVFVLVHRRCPPSLPRHRSVLSAVVCPPT